MPKSYEEELKKAQSLEELKQKYEEIQKQITDQKEVRRLYKAYERRELELYLQKYNELKAIIEKKQKKIAKEKPEIRIKVTRLYLNSRLFTAEHYVAILQQSKDGLQLLFLRKAKLVENQGYLMLENKKLRKVWVLNGEPLLLERPRFPFGKKFVAVWFALPDFPYTLDLTVDESIKQLTLKTLNAPQIVHSIIRTKFFEALARVGSGHDLLMLILGVAIGLGFGVAVGFGIANVNLSNLLSHNMTNSTTVTHTTKVS
jgi:hypothetical protein